MEQNNKWRNVGKYKWLKISPFGNRRTIQIKKRTDKFKKYKYIVLFGTNNPEQYKQWKTTEKQAVKFAKQYMLDHKYG